MWGPNKVNSTLNLIVWLIWSMTPRLKPIQYMIYKHIHGRRHVICCRLRTRSSQKHHIVSNRKRSHDANNYEHNRYEGGLVMVCGGISRNGKTHLLVEQNQPSLLRGHCWSGYEALHRCHWSRLSFYGRICPTTSVLGTVNQCSYGMACAPTRPKTSSDMYWKCSGRQAQPATL